MGCSPSEKPGSGLGFSLAAGRVPTGLVAAPTTPNMEHNLGIMMVSQNVFQTMVAAQNGANLCGNFLRIFWWGHPRQLSSKNDFNIL